MEYGAMAFTPFYNSFQDWLLSNVQLLVDGTFPSAFSKRRALTIVHFFDATHIDGWIEHEDYERASEVFGRVVTSISNPSNLG